MPLRVVWSPGRQVGCGVPGLKSEVVTWKQGTLSVKSLALTNVFYHVLFGVSDAEDDFYQSWSGTKRDETYDISAGEEALLRTILFLRFGRPVLELDGRVAPSLDRLGNGGNLVALVTWLDRGDVADDLLIDVTLVMRFYGSRLAKDSWLVWWILVHKQ